MTLKHCLDFSFVFSAPLSVWRNLFSARGIFCGGRYQQGGIFCSGRRYQEGVGRRYQFLSTSCSTNNSLACHSSVHPDKIWSTMFLLGARIFSLTHFYGYLVVGRGDKGSRRKKDPQKRIWWEALAPGPATSSSSSLPCHAMMNRDDHSLLSRDAAGTRPLCAPSATQIGSWKSWKRRIVVQGVKQKRIKKKRKPGEWTNGWAVGKCEYDPASVDCDSMTITRLNSLSLSPSLYAKTYVKAWVRGSGEWGQKGGVCSRDEIWTWSRSLTCKTN